MEKKKTIHDIDPENIKYLVLHRGLMLNDEELQYGKIYDSEVLAKVPQHTLIGMILAGWLYRGVVEDVERMRQSRLYGFEKMNDATTDQVKQAQVKEIKRLAKKAT